MSESKSGKPVGKTESSAPAGSEVATARRCEISDFAKSIFTSMVAVNPAVFGDLKPTGVVQRAYEAAETFFSASESYLLGESIEDIVAEADAASESDAVPA